MRIRHQCTSGWRDRGAALLERRVPHCRTARSSEHGLPWWPDGSSSGTMARL